MCTGSLVESPICQCIVCFNIEPKRSATELANMFFFSGGEDLEEHVKRTGLLDYVVSEVKKTDGLRSSRF
jgi:hypothetical protein